MKDLGSYLKNERVSSGVSLSEAAEDLNLSITLLENIESGNVRAFKDVYELKEYIKRYAKYLGADPDKAVDEFNGFLFEKTSKISIEDIKEAQSKLNNLQDEEKKKVISPYTTFEERKALLKPILIIIFIFGMSSLISLEFFASADNGSVGSSGYYDQNETNFVSMYDQMYDKANAWIPTYQDLLKGMYGDLNGDFSDFSTLYGANVD